ncbi:MAG: hypothetical protein EXR54_00105 [Dehalococcoidia bacterium]|nr:hypothetical protein [Dehalococcoidia bacterium]MSQ15967.1 hypothetical protein [Dehalococcoidia bacterium]
MAAEPAAKNSPLIQRMIGAAKLNVHTFEEVEGDPKATTQALTVVIIVSLASAIGAVLATIMAGGGAGTLAKDVIFGVVRGIVVWGVWAFLTYILGTTLFKTPDTKANWGQLARTTGFAQSPGVFQALFFIPVVGPIIAVVSSIWQLVAMVIAVRQALDYKNTLRAVGVVVVSFIIVLIPLFLFARALGVGGMSR